MAIVRRFQTSVTTVFVLEFGDLYIRFYTNAQQVDSGGAPYEIVSPYDEADLLELQFTQINDVMYVFHPSYPVNKITRLSDTSWTIEEVEFDQPPFLDENLTAQTITPSAKTGVGITLTAGSPGDLFFDGHVGSFWRIGHFREADTLSQPITGDGSSSEIEVFGPYALRSYGTWDATISFERSTDGGTTWETVHKVVGESDQNLEIKGESTEESLMRITVSGFDSATDARATIESEDAVIYGIVEITAVDSGNASATATVLDDYPLYAATATEIWSEGAWSAYRGYPRAGTVHEQRLVAGGTAHQPSTIWGSKVAFFEDFERGVEDGDSYAHQLAALELNAIQWLASLKALLAGTTGSEWRIIGDELGSIITATKVSAKQFSYYGSEYVQSENTGEVVLMIERKARKLREIRPEGDSFVTKDLSLFASHLFADGYIVQMSWQRDAKILWAVTSDGRLLGMTYHPEESVLGWHPHVTSGSFRSVACIYGDTGADDEVWVIVERTVGSTQVFYVERMFPEGWEDREDYFGVDSGLSYSGTPVSTVGGMEHLAGETVDALVDGVVYSELTVDDLGVVALPSGITGSTIHIGLPFTSLLSPFRLDADTQLGVHLAKSKRIDNLYVRVYRSAGISYDFGGASIPYKAKDGQVTTGIFGETSAEDLPLINKTSNTFDPVLTIRQAQPLPLTVMAIRVGYAVSSS